MPTCFCLRERHGQSTSWRSNFLGMPANAITCHGNVGHGLMTHLLAFYGTQPCRSHVWPGIVRCRVANQCLYLAEEEAVIFMCQTLPGDRLGVFWQRLLPDRSNWLLCRHDAAIVVQLSSPISNNVLWYEMSSIRHQSTMVRLANNIIIGSWHAIYILIMIGSYRMS